MAFVTYVYLKLARFLSSANQRDLPEERLVLALIITGGAIEENRALAEREVDFFDLKGALETGVDWMGFTPLVYTKGEAKHLR
jgi:hypothetical protein